MRKHSRLLVYLLGIAVLVLPALAACTPAASSPTAAPAATAASKPATAPTAASSAASPAASTAPFVIGFVNSSSGYMAPMGGQERDAVVMLEEKFNKAGGINGRPIKIIYYDDESDESKGVMAIKKLINDDKVLGIIGTAASGIAMAESPIAEEAQVPFVSMNSSYSILLNPAKKWVFKVAASEKFLVGGIYRYLKSKGITSYAWFNQGAGFGREATKYMQDTYKAQGFTLTAAEEYGPTDTSMTPQLTKIKATNPQALVVYGAEAAGAMAIKQARDLGMNIPIVGPPSMTTGAIMNVAELRQGMEGSIFVAFKPDMWQQLPDNDPQKKVNQEFAAGMTAKYGANFKGLEWPMGVGYDALSIMVNAIKASNPDTSNLPAARSKVRDALEQTKGYIGSFGMLDQSPTEHEGLSWDSVVMAQITGGKYQLMK